ncbi:restriction endonuclease subunit S [Dehalobacter sp. TBBPA1]|uniref:restriction endonuclease subunit S n=1 Tax=Dehalobacter sp. TBBPA1 TaxID=3235037 RepID=UPI0034A165E5
MERYASYKDSGISWLGLTPSHWTVGRIKNLMSLQRGYDLSQDNFVEGDVPVFGSNGIVGYHNVATTKAPGITIGRSGSIGAVNYVDTDFWAHNTAIYVKDMKNNNARYLYYVLLSFNIANLGNGSVVPTLDRKNVETMPFSFTLNSEEQLAIAMYLDRRTSAIDEVLTDLQSQAEMLDTYKRELIAGAVTKGLDKATPSKDSGVEWIGEIPVHWEQHPLFTVAKENMVRNTSMACNNLLSLSYGKIIKKDIDTNFGLLPASFEGYQIVQPGYTVLRLTDLQNDKRSLRTGFVTETGIITSAYLGLIPSLQLDSKYFTYLLHAYDLLKIYYGLGGGLRQTLKFTDMKRLPVLTPPMTEQQQIVEFIDSKSTKIDGLIADIKAQIDKLKQYRQIVIHGVVTGKIKVTEG